METLDDKKPLPGDAMQKKRMICLTVGFSGVHVLVDVMVTLSVSWRRLGNFD